MTGPTETIVCVECGGTARLMTVLPEDETLEPGSLVVYHCPDCLARFDLVWEDPPD